MCVTPRSPRGDLSGPQPALEPPPAEDHVGHPLAVLIFTTCAYVAGRVNAVLQDPFPEQPPPQLPQRLGWGSASPEPEEAQASPLPSPRAPPSPPAPTWDPLLRKQDEDTLKELKYRTYSFFPWSFS